MMRVKKPCLLAAFSVLCLLARADVYVATAENGGSDSNAGTAEAPFLTIAQGVSCAAAGETVHVGPGDFAISATISLAKDVKVVGAGRYRTTVKPVTTCPRGFSLNHASAELACLRVTGFSGSGNSCYGMGVKIDTKGGTVRDCLIEGNTDHEVNYIGGGAGLSLAAGKAVRTIIANNRTGTKGNFNTSGSGVYMTGGVLESCLVVSNQTSGAAKYTHTGGGIYATGGSIVNCTVADNSCSQHGGSIAIPSGSPTIVNTVFIHNSTGGSGSDIEAHDGYDFSLMTHCVSDADLGVSPVSGVRLTDPEHGDYTIPADLPGSGAGLVTGVEFASDTDLAGTTRVIAGAIDLGCYQFDGRAASVGIVPSKSVFRVGETLRLTAVPHALPADGNAYFWTLTGSHGNSYDGIGNPLDAALTRGGSFDVTVVVSNGVSEVARRTFPTCLFVNDLEVCVSTTGDDVNNTGWTADDAFATIEKGVAVLKPLVAEANAVVYAAPTNRAVVHVGAGEFTISAQVLLDDAIVVRGAGRDATFVTAPHDLAGPNISKVHAPLVLTAAGAGVEDLTIWKCKWTGYDCLGVGLYMTRGAVRNCTLTGNSGTNWRNYGAGVYMTGGTVDHCVISNNSLTTGMRYGGGVAMFGGSVENSLIVGNSLVKNTENYTGGGVYMEGGTLLNCTVADNKTGSTSAGVYVAANSPKIVNCVIAGNLKSSVTPAVASEFDSYANYDRTLLDHCAIPDFAGGTATASGAIDFADGYTLGASSSAIDAGRDDQTYASTGDLAGNGRRSGDHVDAGCYEYDLSGYAASFTVSAATVLTGASVTLTPSVVSPSDENLLTYAWTVTSDTGVTSNYTDRVVTTAFDVGGHYDVTLVVTDPQKGEAVDVKAECLYVISTVRYVATAENGGDDSNHGQSPAAPLLSVRKAYDEVFEACQNAQTDGTIHVGPGTFPVPSNMTLSQPIHVLGAGRDLTVLTQATRPGAYRCFTLDNASAEVAGVTIRDFSNNSNGAFEGGGVRITANGGLVRDSALRNNDGQAPHLKGAGAYLAGGHLLRCVVSGCATYNNIHNGGGVYMTDGLVENCLIVSNRTARASDPDANGGGIYLTGGTLLNSTIADNSSKNRGGGVYASGADTRIVNCIVTGNTAVNEGRDVFVTDSVQPENLLNNYFGGQDLGTDPVTADLDFVAGGYALRASSRAIDASFTSGIDFAPTDLDGHPRQNGAGIDLGCREYDQSVFACGLRAANVSVFADTDFTLFSRVFGAPTGAQLEYTWTISNGVDAPRQYSGTSVTDAFSLPGDYTVTLAVHDTVSGQSVTETRDGYLYVVSLDRYVAPSGSDADTGLDAAHPFGSLEHAVAAVRDVAVSAGLQATLHVAAGEYVISNTLALSQAVRVAGAGRDVTIVRGGKSMNSGVSISHDDAVLSGLTITNVVRSGYDSVGIGLYLTKGLVSDCRVTGCSFDTGWRGDGCGAYVAGGRLVDTIIENCSMPAADRRGAGVFMTGGTVERCLIRNNRLPKFQNHESTGAGVYMTGGHLLNCSVVGNSTEILAGGVYAAGASTVVSNCLIAGNIAWEEDSDTAPDLRLAASFNPDHLVNCFIGRVADAFVDADAVPLAGSPLVAAGIGWKTFAPLEPCVGFATDRAEALAGEPLVFTGTVYGAAPGAFSWTIQPPTGAAIAASGATFGRAFDEPGVYAVTLTVDGVGSLTRPAAFRIGPRTIALEDGGDVAAAVATAVDGTVITLAAGTYGLNEELLVDRRIDLVGAGRDASVLCRTNTKSAAVCRAVRLSGGGTLGKLAITGGRIDQIGSANYNSHWYGAGLWLTGRGGTVSDCRVYGNRITGANAQIGAGLVLHSSKGRVTRTLIDGNTAVADSSYGGGAAVYAGRMDNCLVLTNSAAIRGGGVVLSGSGAELVNCTIAGNHCGTGAGGLYLMSGEPLIANNVLSGNTSGSTGDFTGKPQWGARKEIDGNNSYNLYPQLTNAVMNCAFVTGDSVGAAAVVCADAQFRDPENGDYRIRLASPLRHRGCDLGPWLEASTDYYGNRRVVFRKRVDIGCHQTTPNGTMLIIR